MSDDTYEVYAVKYAHHPRKAAENYIGGDPHDVLQPLDYFVWAMVNPARTILLDTGFDQAVADRRKRQLLKPLRDGLKAVRRRSRTGRDHHPQPHALRPLRQPHHVPAGALPRAG